MTLLSDVLRMFEAGLVLRVVFTPDGQRCVIHRTDGALPVSLTGLHAGAVAIALAAMAAGPLAHNDDDDPDEGIDLAQPLPD